MQRGEFGLHLGADLVDELGRVQRLLKRLVVLASALLKVGRQILVGVAPPVRADDPDLLAAKLVAQRLEGRDLVDHPQHALTVAAILLVGERPPVVIQAGVGRDRLAGRVVGQVLAPSVGGDQFERVQHRPVRGVVGAELEYLQ